ncbi:glycosyltransferase family 4 protein [Solwaraspora sp. WMMD1047]|uniref:glycosyltransferase family 4 protein n=1 Tax=Solwaraspora sp. WMMD1047 TaxID=3016102 RepID=UPI002416E82E|nr:glycosyltransferase family 4 protein [Solwaraspora sp. WMMD1047]MDG4831789.1 glycosyltransferase family 4 protein [Solwaraspora sp. WMMD1047]
MSPDAEVFDIQQARRQRVLMLSWEYPPVLVGGLGRHVHALATSLATAGHDVTVITRHADGAPLEEYTDGVRVIRAPEDPVGFALATPTLLAWTMAFNHTLTRAALRAADTSGGYDIIHAHDWLVAHTAVTLKEHLNLPLITTIHATEAGRHQGWLPDDLNKTIHSVEHWLSHESTRLIVCSEYMRQQVGHLFDVSPERVDVVPNGVDDRAWHARPRAVASARKRFAGDGPLIGYAGRLVYEKGVQHLMHAVPQLRDRHPGLRVVIAGDGPYRAELQEEARRLKLERTVRFAGFMTASQLPAVLGATDATVVPSLYEPFGMVALEAAAAGAPLAVAATGGLAEIVEPGVTGVTFPHSNPDALAGAVGSLLADEVFARRVARRARSMVSERYGWTTIAGRTAAGYAAAVRDSAGVRRAGPPVGNPVGARGRRIVVPEGNLFALDGAAC